MITYFFRPKLNGLNANNMWTSKRRRYVPQITTLNILQKRLERENVNWSPKSCDYNPIELFLWGFLKQQMYANKLQTTAVNIIRTIGQSQTDLCIKVMESAAKVDEISLNISQIWYPLPPVFQFPKTKNPKLLARLTLVFLCHRPIFAGHSP